MPDDQPTPGHGQYDWRAEVIVAQVPGTADPMQEALRVVLHSLNRDQEAAGWGQLPALQLVVRRQAVAEPGACSIGLMLVPLPVAAERWHAAPVGDALDRVVTKATGGDDPLPQVPESVGELVGVAFISEAWTRDDTLGPDAAPVETRVVSVLDTVGGRYLLLQFRGGGTAVAGPGDRPQPEGRVFGLLGRLLSAWPT